MLLYPTERTADYVSPSYEVEEILTPNDPDHRHEAVSGELFNTQHEFLEDHYKRVRELQDQTFHEPPEKPLRRENVSLNEPQSSQEPLTQSLQSPSATAPLRGERFPKPANKSKEKPEPT
jgi:hypothetical protein